MPTGYRKRAVLNVIKNSIYGLFLAPGRGKTGIILEAFRILKKANKIDLMIVVAKVNIIYSTWPREIEKWEFDFKYHIQHSNKKDIYVDADVMLVSYGGLKWLHDELKKSKLYKKKRIMIVLDESSKIKNTKTKRFKVIRKIAGWFERRYILTGSPAPNGLKDLFGQVFFLDLGKTFGKYITHFLVSYFYPTGFQGYDWKLQPGMEKQIYKKLKPLVMRLGESDKLPPLNKVYRPVILPDDARRFYNEFEKEFISEINSSIITAANAGVKTGRLRQVTSGNIYNEKKETVYIHEAKLDEVEEIFEELQGSPCLVAYEFQHELQALIKRFPDAKYFDGNKKKNLQLENDWNAGRIEKLFGQTSSIAHGLNLQESGHHMIIMTMTWNLEDYEQLIKRLHREGQKNPVTVIHLVVENSIDEGVIAAVNVKDVNQKSLLNALEDHYKEKGATTLKKDSAKDKKQKADTKRIGKLEQDMYDKQSKGETKMATKKKSTSKKKASKKKSYRQAGEKGAIKKKRGSSKTTSKKITSKKTTSKKTTLSNKSDRSTKGSDFSVVIGSVAVEREGISKVVQNKATSKPMSFKMLHSRVKADPISKGKDDDWVTYHIKNCVRKGLLDKA